MIHEHSQIMYSLFVSGQQKAVYADYVLSLLKPEFSEKGSSRRVDKEYMMDYFQDFVMGLEDKNVNGDSEALAWAAGDGNGVNVAENGSVMHGLIFVNVIQGDDINDSNFHFRIFGLFMPSFCNLTFLLL